MGEAKREIRMVAELVPQRVYRLSPLMSNKAIAGKSVVFKGWLERPWDMRRAVVRILLPDGSEGEEWLVNPYFVISKRN